MIPFLILMPFELVHVINYDGYTTLAGMASAIGTNPGELLEFIHSYRHYIYLSYPLIILCIILFFKYVRINDRLSGFTRSTIARCICRNSGAVYRKKYVRPVCS